MNSVCMTYMHLMHRLIFYEETCFTIFSLTACSSLLVNHQIVAVVFVAHYKFTQSGVIPTSPYRTTPSWEKRSHASMG